MAGHPHATPLWRGSLASFADHLPARTAQHLRGSIFDPSSRSPPVFRAMTKSPTHNTILEPDFSNCGLCPALSPRGCRQRSGNFAAYVLGGIGGALVDDMGVGCECRARPFMAQNGRDRDR